MTNTVSTEDSQTQRTTRQIGVKSILSVFTVLIVAFIDLPTTLIISCSLIPTYIAYYVDRRPQKYIAICVGCFNALALMIILLTFWTTGSNITNAIKTLTNPTNWVTLLGCSAVGWVIVSVVPVLTKAYLRITYDLTIKSLTKSKDKLAQYWTVPLDDRPSDS